MLREFASDIKGTVVESMNKSKSFYNSPFGFIRALSCRGSSGTPRPTRTDPYTWDPGGGIIINLLTNKR